MATRCNITIDDETGKYRIYRHWDGYPKGVISDLKVMFDNGLSGYDSEYFLANFIFYAKLNDMRRAKARGSKGKYWETGYGVCSPNCEHDDLEYKYTLSRKKDRIAIEEYDFDTYEFRTVFNGTIKEAIEEYAEEGGCHISPEVFQEQDQDQDEEGKASSFSSSLDARGQVV